MSELLIDSQIRFWVYLPIVIIAFLNGIVRHYITYLLSSENKLDLQQLQDSHILRRSQLLRYNGKYLPYQSFQMRFEFFNNKDKGYLTTRRPLTPNKNLFAHPAYLKEMVKGQISYLLPMIIVGGWINFTFSGFVASKIPFPLTLQFQDMLQRGIELRSLDASWVSSASWYFLNVCGLRSFHNLVLSENEDSEDELTQLSATPPSEIHTLFKEEWEALEITEHTWNLQNIEKEILARRNNSC